MKWAQLIVILILTLAYLRSPVDLIPDPLGALGFIDDLIIVLLALAWVQRQRRPQTQGPRGAAAGSAHRGQAGPEPERWDPYTVLGVPRGASSAEITRAYRQQIKHYHPDRVASLGTELQELAHRKTLEIQRAYAEISSR